MSAPASPLPRVVPPRPRRPFRRLLRWCFLLLVLALASLFIPAVFQFAVRGLLTFEAWQHGSRVEIDELTGSFQEPIRLRNTRWTYDSPAGSVAHVSIEDAEADFDWKALLPTQGGRWFKRLALNGVAGRVEVPVVVKHEIAAPTAPPRPLPEVALPSAWPVPSVIEANGVDLTVVTGDNSTRIEESRWTLSELESGVVEAGQVVVKQPWLNRTFRNVHGTTALESSKVIIADLQLDKGVVVTKASAELTKIAKGILNLYIDIAAFGGEIETQADTLPRESEIQVSASTNFRQINVAALATFLGLSEAAGGQIEQGTFNFRGALADLPRAYASLRFNARNFQWESRQWDSLVLGATLLDRRVEIPEFQLKQGQNELSISGKFALPKDGTEWWQNEFDMNIAGRIENLTDLSALLLPDFQYAAGKATIDGSIRGRDQQFHGQLIVSGADLTWRKAPIKELHAALRLDGNELQLATLDLINGEDYVHGRGVINIVGPKQYWGELRASVQDLAVYSSLMQKPLVPEPLAGGASVNWQGEGSAERSSGSFFARLQKVRSLGATGSQLHPVNAELEGAYAPGALQFSRFAVSDDTSSFSAKVQVGEKSVSLTEIQLQQGMELRLAGDALLPIDVWSAWPGGNMGQFLTENIPTQFKLKATNLRLADALRLSGWNWAIDGGVTGEIAGKGSGAALAMEGSLELREGKLPLGWNGDVLTDVSADISLAGPKLVVAKSSLKHASGLYQASGAVDLQNIRDPWLAIELQSDRATARLLPEWTLASTFGIDTKSKRLDLQVASKLKLQLTGPAHAASLAGDVRMLGFETARPFDLRPLWSATSTAPPAFFGWASEPWASCKLDLRCTFDENYERPDERLEGKIGITPMWSGELRLTGPGAAPEIEGTLTLNSSVATPRATVSSNGFPLFVTGGSVTFHPGVPIDPTVDFSFEGYLHSLPFHASIIGPLSHRIAFIDSEEARVILLALAPLTLPVGEVDAQNSTGQNGLLRPLVFPWKPAESPAALSVPPPGVVIPAPDAPKPPASATPAPPTAPPPAPEAAK